MYSPNMALSLAIILIVSVIAFALYLNGSLYDSSRILEEHLSLIERSTSSGDWEKAGVEVEKLKTAWADIEKKWAIFIDHFEIDNIENSISRMSMFIEAKDKSLALAEISALFQMVQHIPEKEKFSIKNIF